MIRCTFPGRYGDVIWALPTVRALAEANGGQVDLQIAGEFAPIAELLRQQPYLHRVWVDMSWNLTPEHAWQPPPFPWTSDDQVVHLGYRGWPSCPLAQYVEAQTQIHYPSLPMAAVDLDRPWITAPALGDTATLVCGWSDAWFELKYGLMALLTGTAPMLVLAAPGSRWALDAPRWMYRYWRLHPTGWVGAAQALASAKVFLGCCSALHVLAAAMGIPTVVVEPMEARHNPIFYPLGTTGKVKLVLGHDGKPTFDARHTYDVLQEVLDGR